MHMYDAYVRTVQVYMYLSQSTQQASVAVTSGGVLLTLGGVLLTSGGELFTCLNCDRKVGLLCTLIIVGCGRVCSSLPLLVAS